MRRLHEHQSVTIEIDRPSASIECLVLAIDGGEATLEPVDVQRTRMLTNAENPALLTFEYRSQLFSLRGIARRDDTSGDLRFTVSDRVTVPERRRHARVELELPLTLSPLPNGSDGHGAPAVETRTSGLSAEGLLTEAPLPATEQNWRLTLGLPAGPPIVCEARTVRNVAGGTALSYTQMRPEDRERLRELVAERKRAELRRGRR